MYEYYNYYSLVSLSKKKQWFWTEWASTTFIIVTGLWIYAQFKKLDVFFKRLSEGGIMLTMNRRL